MIFISKNPLQTKKFALRLAKKLKGGQILALVGDLGGGKTCFTKGLAKGLGVQKTILSPSFILMKIYPLKKGAIRHFCHVDLYRLKRPRDMVHLGLKEYLGQKNAICAIEWADKIKRLLEPYKKIILHFQFIDGHTRKITLKKQAEGW